MRGSETRDLGAGGGLAPAVVSVAGPSGAGKTSLLECVLPELVRRGWRTGYLKADAHRIDLEPDSKDTARMRRAGAAAVAIRGRGGEVHIPVPPPLVSQDLTPHRSAGVPTPPEQLRIDHAARAGLWNLAELFRGCDLVIVEGHRHSGLPKILVRPGGALGRVDPADASGPVRLALRWSRLPEDWGPPVQQTANTLEAEILAPARLAARGVMGVVLAGGASRRMGTDKARLRWPESLGGTLSGTTTVGTWLERMCLLAARRCAEVWVLGRIVSATEVPNLRRVPRSHLDLRPDAGPLGGIETALRVAGGAAVLALPVDMPDLSDDIVDRLLEGRGKGDATVLRHPDGTDEAALGIYEPGAAEALQRYLDAGGRSVGAFLDRIRVDGVTLTSEETAALRNRNDPGA